MRGSAPRRTVDAAASRGVRIKTSRAARGGVSIENRMGDRNLRTPVNVQRPAHTGATTTTGPGGAGIRTAGRPGGVAILQRKVVDTDRRGAGDPQQSIGVAAVDHHGRVAWTVNFDVFGDVRKIGSQRNRAAGSAQIDRSTAGNVANRLPQRSGSTIGRVAYRKGGRGNIRQIILTTDTREACQSGFRKKFGGQRIAAGVGHMAIYGCDRAESRQPEQSGRQKV